MSLATDKFFYKALKESADIIEVTEGRIYNTIDDELDPDSSALPSILILNEGTQNQTESKDDGMESETDIDSIMIGISARSRKELADIATLVRKVIKEKANNFDDDDAEELGFYLNDYTFTSSAVTWDQMKPCYWQELNYQCETENE